MYSGSMLKWLIEGDRSLQIDCSRQKRLKGSVHPNETYFLAYLWWNLAMKVALVLFVQVLRFLSLRFLLKP